MNTLVLDTNVVSYLMKGHSLANAYRSLIAQHRLAISFMTVAELYDGAIWARWGSVKRQLLDEAIHQYLVIPSSPAVCRLWGEVRYARRTQPISSEDAWIAASALSQGCDLVTHNSTDFMNIPQLHVVTAVQP
jgi:tRNA(fMet)-specific endonuclease VapC